MTKKDLFASVVVFLVALPLSLGIALASGANPSQGLIAAAVGGIVVGLFGGAPLQVSGPAAGLTVMVYGFVQSYGMAGLQVITIMGGIFQLAVGFLGAAELALIIAPSILHGMLAGIGALICISQAHVLMGHVPKSSPIENIANLWTGITTSNLSAVAIGGGVLLFLHLWEKYKPKSLSVIPGSLIAIGVATVAAYFGQLDIRFVQIPSQLWNSFQFDSSVWVRPEVYGSALALMVVASSESLLCAVATDRLHTGARADLKKELIAQGIGNTLSGFLGALPITGVIVRSSANIAAGATTKWSAVLHGVWALVFVMAFPGLLNKIPLAALAGLLVYIGLKLIKLHEMKRFFKYNEGWVYLGTFAGVVGINLLWGIGIGLALSTVSFLYRSSRINVSSSKTSDGTEIHLDGHLTFLTVPSISRTLGALEPRQHIRLHIKPQSLDMSALDAIRGWRQSYESQGGRVTKTSLDEVWEKQRRV